MSSCAPVELPTLSAIAACLQIPAPPLLPDYSCPDLEKMQFASDLQTMQFLAFIKAAIDPMMAFAGQIPMPVVPELGLTLPEVLALTPETIKSITATVDFSSIKPATLPDPVLGDQTFPTFDALAKFNALIREYCTLMVTAFKTLMDMVKDVLSQEPFEVDISLPIMPEMPTDFNSLMALVYPTVGATDYQSFLAKVSGISPAPSISDIFASVTPPGFEGMAIEFPSPFFPTVSAPSIEIVEISKNYYMAMIMFLGTKVKEFSATVSAFITITFPTIIAEA